MSDPITKQPMYPRDQGARSEGDADATRRQLLRAAAAAPFLATIPNGSVFANTSAFHCVVTSAQASNAGAPVLSRSSLVGDKWVRRAVTSRRLRTTQAGYPPSLDVWLIDGTWYDASGNIVTPNLSGTCDLALEYCPGPSGPQTVYVLEIYQPVPDAADPTSVTKIGPYPKYSTAYNRPSQVGNIGLFASCMCSVAPGSDVSGIFCQV